jgi:hypothetical protein
MTYLFRISAHAVMGRIAQLMWPHILMGAVSRDWRREYEMEATKH